MQWTDSWIAHAGPKTLSWPRNLLAAGLVARRPGLGYDWAKVTQNACETFAVQLSRISILALSGGFVLKGFWSISNSAERHLSFHGGTATHVSIKYNLVGRSIEGVSTDQWNKHPLISALMLLTCEQFLQLPKLSTACHALNPFSQKAITNVWILTSNLPSQGCLPHGLWAESSPVFWRFYHRCRGTGFSFWIYPVKPLNLLWPATVQCSENAQHERLRWTMFLVRNHVWYNIHLIMRSSWQNLWQEPLFRFGLIADVQLDPQSQVSETATRFQQHCSIKLGYIYI